MIRDDISETAEMLLQMVDALEDAEKCHTIMLMAMYLLNWASSMLAQSHQNDASRTFKSLASDVETLYSNLRETGLQQMPVQSGNIVNMRRP